MKEERTLLVFLRPQWYYKERKLETNTLYWTQMQKFLIDFNKLNPGIYKKW